MSTLIAIGLWVGGIWGFSRLTVRIVRLEADVARLREQAKGGSVTPPVKEPRPVPRPPSTVTPVTPPGPPVTAPVPPATPPSPASVSPAPRPSVGSVEAGTSGPGGWERLWRVNVPAKLGVLISLLGFAFLLKLAVDQGWLSFPITARLIVVGLIGLAFVGQGWRWRNNRPHLSRALQGGGIATLDLTIYSAVLVFDVLSPTIGFALLGLITVGAGLLATALHSRVLALLGIVGGLGAPLLIPAASSQLTAVLAYYVLLNAATFGLTWREDWPALNLFAFFGTFGSGLLWTIDRSWGAPFGAELMIFLLFLMYVAILVVSHLRRGSPRLSPVDHALLLGVPSATFVMLAVFLLDSDALAVRSLVLGLFYGGLARALHVSSRHCPALVTYFSALACGLVALAIPLGLDAQWVAALWALGGALQVFVATRQGSRGYAWSGVGLLLLSGLAWSLQAGSVEQARAFFHGHFLGAVWIAVLGLLAAWWLDRAPREDKTLSRLGWVPFAWGALWWVGAWFAELRRLAPEPLETTVLLLFGAATAYLSLDLDRAVRWRKLDVVAPAAGIGLLLAFSNILPELRHPAAYFGWVAWPVALFVQLQLTRRAELLHPKRFPYGYGITHAVTMAWVAWESFWLVDQIANDVWSLTVVAIVLATLAYFGITPAVGPRWPVGASRESYQRWLPALMSVFLLVLIGALQISAGDPSPLPFVPLLNPLDVATALALVLFAKVGRVHRLAEGRSVVAGLALICSSLTVLRTVHHWVGVPFEFAALLSSMTAQATLTVYWAVLGLVGMVAGARLARRLAWKAGAGLMTVVVLKLFLIDLAGVNTAARIVSFLGTGGLLLLIGYLAPQPPRLVSPPCHRPS